jgi:ribonuclease J
MRITPLGGCGEFGLHSTLFQLGTAALCVDAGLLFPDEGTPGVDYLVPDFAALRGAGVIAYLLTHGHEDHIGALGFALETAPAPVFGTPFCLELARHRLEERGLLRRADLRPIDGERAMELGDFRVQAVPVRHSVPEAVGYLIEGGGARVYVTGDHRGLLADAPSEIDLMLADSTGILRPGRTPEEASVTRAIEAALTAHPRERRAFVTLFSTHVERLGNILDIAARVGRTVGLAGRSLERNADAAQRLGRLRPPHGVLVPATQASLVVATGGQGEERSALARIAAGQHPDLHAAPGDLVLFCGRPILGNERAVARLGDTLVLRGLVVGDAPELHTSGHGSAEDLAALLREVRPRCLVPMHGRPRHLQAHADLARAEGVPSARVLRNGEQCEIRAGGVFRSGTLPAGRLAVEGTRARAPSSRPSFWPRCARVDRRR